MIGEMRDVLIVSQPPDQFLLAFGHGHPDRSGRIWIVPEEEHRHTSFIAKDIDHPLDLALGAVGPVLILIHLDKYFVGAVVVLDLFFFGMPLSARVGHLPTDRIWATVMRSQDLNDSFLTEFLITAIAMIVLFQTTVIHAQTVPQSIQSPAFST
jgi:hypothetical protein